MQFAIWVVVNSSSSPLLSTITLR